MPKTSTKTKYQQLIVTLIEDVLRIAADEYVEPIQVTKGLYCKNGGRLTDWELRCIGGLASAIRDNFPNAEKDIGGVRGMQRRNLYVGKLERELGDWEYWLGRFRETIKDALKDDPIKILAPRKWSRRKVSKIRRANICHISDTHFGIRIDPLEVPGNEYNWRVAARRFSKMAAAIANYKRDHRDECETLYLCGGGDLGQGSIHTEDANVDLLTYQILGAARYWIAFIEYQLNEYRRIVVSTTPDNHWRMINHVKGRERARAQKFDSYNTIMFEIVQQAFRHNSAVMFNIPKTPYTEFKVFGRTHFLTHGDTHFEIGNPGGKLAVDRIASKIDAMNAPRNEADKIIVVQCGHVHVGLRLSLDNGVDLFVNPSMSGIDPYAQSIGLTKSRPGQWMFESTNIHSVGDSRLVEVSDADNDDSYDQIIPPFNYDLVAAKVGIKDVRF